MLIYYSNNYSRYFLHVLDNNNTYYILRAVYIYYLLYNIIYHEDSLDYIYN